MPTQAAAHNGPLFGRRAEGHLQLGFRVGPHHVNPGQSCHDGVLSTSVDILLSSAAQYQTDGVTVLRTSGVFRRGPLLKFTIARSRS